MVLKLIRQAVLLLAVLTVAAATIGFTGRPPVNPAFDPKATIQATVEMPDAVSRMLRRSCFDCHSQETTWPWYTRLPIASGLMRHDVEAARKALNFSDWASGPGRRPELGVAMLQAACADVKQGRMPKRRYLLLHPGAKISAAEANTFCAWVNDETRRVVQARHPALKRAALTKVLHPENNQ